MAPPEIRSMRPKAIIEEGIDQTCMNSRGGDPVGGAAVGLSAVQPHAGGLQINASDPSWRSSLFFDATQCVASSLLARRPPWRPLPRSNRRKTCLRDRLDQRMPAVIPTSSPTIWRPAALHAFFRFWRAVALIRRVHDA